MFTSNKFRYGLIGLAVILIIVHLMEIDYENFNWKDLLLPVSMFFLILSMILSLNQSNKDGE